MQYKLGTHIFLEKEEFKSLKLEIKKVIKAISVIDKTYKSLKKDEYCDDEYYSVDEEILK